MVDWDSLDRLRGIFLEAAPTAESYWTSVADLESYDFTYAQRIAWKWTAVLADLSRLGWQPPTGPILDWGCGSGVASRCVVAHFGASSFGSMLLHDRSPLAVEFACKRGTGRFPGMSVAPGETYLAEGGPIGTLVLSHVLNELPPEAHPELAAIVRRAECVIWVEPGTHEVSRALGAIRARLLAEFRVVAPCTHQAACGLLAPGNERHWCHMFAHPPMEIFIDSGWSRFAQRAGIDLRSLPYSYLVLDRRPATGSQPGAKDAVRVIGDSRIYKGYLKIMGCNADGAAESMLQQRDDPEMFRRIKSGKATNLQKWSQHGGKITEIAEYPDATLPR